MTLIQCKVGHTNTIAEKLEAEFGERLIRLGPKANAATLASLLNEIVSGSGSLPQPSSARTAHVLIIAALNLVRVEAAPLPQPQDLSPLAFLLAQQQVEKVHVSVVHCDSSIVSVQSSSMWQPSKWGWLNYHAPSCLNST